MPRQETPAVRQRDGWINTGLLVAREATEGNVRGLYTTAERAGEVWAKRSGYRVPGGAYLRGFVAATAYYLGRNVFRLHGAPGRVGHVVTDLEAPVVATYHRKMLGNTKARAEPCPTDELEAALENGPPELRPGADATPGGFDA